MSGCRTYNFICLEESPNTHFPIFSESKKVAVVKAVFPLQAEKRCEQ